MIKFTLDGKEYSVQDDVVIRDGTSEELASYIITIPNSEKLDIETMDYGVLELDDRNMLSMVLNAYNEETIAFNPLRYRYTLSLISETIKLQKISCPNLKITKRGVKTPLTIWEKMQQYYEVYIQPQYPELTLSSDLQELLGDTICPEKMWNRPNMYEVFNELLQVKNAQVDVRLNQITYKYPKLDDIGNEIDVNKLSLENHTQNINDYANKLDIEVKNGIGDISAYSIQGISQRTYSAAVLTEDNAQFILDKPIDEIYNVRIFVPTTAISEDYYELDITQYVVENNIYNTYYTSSNGVDFMATTDDIRYKRLALHYTQGSNTIDGLGYDEKQLIASSKSAIRTIVYRLIYQMYGEDAAKVAVETTLTPIPKTPDSRKWMLVVNYRPIDSFRFNVSKKSKHNATLQDNQVDSYVDIKDFINSEQEKLNRFGNKSMIISGKYKSYNDIPKLSDYIDDYILAEREIVIHDHFVLFKGTLYKDYVRKNVYYGLNSRKRNTIIATGKEALLRNDIIERDYSFSTTNEKPLEKHYVQRYLLSGINEYGLKGIIQPSLNNALIKTYDKDGKDILGENFIIKKMTSYADSKINLANFSMEDNFSAGMKTSEKGDIGGYGQEYISYVDSDGEFKKISINIRTNESSYIVGDMQMENYRYETSSNLPLLSETEDVALFPTTYHIDTLEKVLYKDNGEITAITTQYNFIDSDEVIIGTFGKYTPVGLNRKNIPDLVIYYSNIETYEIGDKTCKGQKSNAYIDNQMQKNWNDGDRTNVFNYINIYNTTGMNNCRSWAIGRENGELLLGINCINGFKNTIYMNENE